MPAKAVIEATVKRYFKSIRDMNLQDWLGTMAPDAVSQDPVGAPPTEGHEALTGFFQGILAVFAEVDIREESVFICGNQAAIKFVGQGVARNGVPVKFEGIDIFEVNEEGLIQKILAYWDPAGMVSKLQSP